MGEPRPPTEQDRVRRDTVYLKATHKVFTDGRLARLSEPHPMIRDKTGKETQHREPKWKFGEEVALRRCPTNAGYVAQERASWIEGWLYADEICGERGVSAAKAADPLKMPHKRTVSLAEPLEAFPECILSEDDARAYAAREERIRMGLPEHQAPVLAGEQDDR